MVSGKKIVSIIEVILVYLDDNNIEYETKTLYEFPAVVNYLLLKSVKLRNINSKSQSAKQLINVTHFL